MRHDGHLVQRGLAVEEHHVAVVQVPLNDVTELELRGHPPAVPVLEVLRAAALEAHEVGARVVVHAVANPLADHLDVVPGNHLGVRHHLRDVQRDPQLVYTKVGIRRDHRAARKVDALPRQVSAEPPLLALEPLHEPAQGLA